MKSFWLENPDLWLVRRFDTLQRIYATALHRVGGAALTWTLGRRLLEQSDLATVQERIAGSWRQSWLSMPTPLGFASLEERATFSSYVDYLRRRAQAADAEPAWALAMADEHGWPEEWQDRVGEAPRLPRRGSSATLGGLGAAAPTVPPVVRRALRPFHAGAGIALPRVGGPDAAQGDSSAGPLAMFGRLEDWFLNRRGSECPPVEFANRRALAALGPAYRSAVGVIGYVVACETSVVMPPAGPGPFTSCELTSASVYLGQLVALGRPLGADDALLWVTLCRKDRRRMEDPTFRAAWADSFSRAFPEGLRIGDAGPPLPFTYISPRHGGPPTLVTLAIEGAVVPSLPRALLSADLVKLLKFVEAQHFASDGAASVP